MERLKRLWRETRPEIIGGLVVAAIVGIAGAITSLNRQGITWLIGTAVAVGAWLVCLYIAFQRTKTGLIGGRGVWRFPRGRRWAQAGLIAVPLLVAGSIGYYLYRQTQPPVEILILVADFDGPDPQNYRVTETLLYRLHQELEPYDDVQVRAMGKTITEREGSSVARAEGKKHEATIVIWGWYGVTSETSVLGAHFELLHPPQYWPDASPHSLRSLQQLAISDLEHFIVQTQVSDDMCYLSLLTAGLTQFELGNMHETIELLTAALEQSPEYLAEPDLSIAYFYRGNAHFCESAHDNAIADFDHALEISPSIDAARYNLKIAYNNRGIVHAQMEQYDAALEDFARAMQDDPEYIEPYNNRGITYARMGDFNAALADFTRAIEVDDGNAQLYNNRGYTYFEIGRYRDALMDYERALELRPDYMVAYTNRADLHSEIGEHAAAIADYNRVLEMDPEYARGYCNRGFSYYELGERDKAIADYTRALELDPSYALAYYNRGNTYKDSGDYEAAIADYAQAVALDPNLAEAYCNRGKVFLTLEQYDVALVDFNRALGVDPNLVQAYNNRGIVLLAEGKNDAAASDFSRAIELDPKFAAAYLNRGLLYKNTGRIEEAIADLERCLELTSDPQLRQLVEAKLEVLRNQS